MSPVRQRSHKYGARPTEVDGIRFASQKEAQRYQELKLLEKAGEIHKLVLQPGFALSVQRRGAPALLPFKLGEYRADFLYCECRRAAKCESTQLIVEDVKGYDVPLGRWKRRHAEAQYGISIRLIK